MEDRNRDMQRFFAACDELITGKFIVAEKKISELLRSVATCDDLMGLFTAVTRGFDYQAAKRAYLREPINTRTRGEAYLPAEETELLAFVFCLLVEFDNGTMRLGDFLLHYFYEDGSYTASYALFVERVIRPFRDVIRRCFPVAGRGTAVMFRRKEEGILEMIAERLMAERSRLPSLPLREGDAFAGETIISELLVAVDRKDIPAIKALLFGYGYYLCYVRNSSENSDELFRLAGEL